MHHIGLDVGSCKTHICVNREDGQLILEDALKTALLPQFFSGLSKEKPGSRVILESCAEAFSIAAWAQEAGLDVRIVPAAFAKSLGIGEHGIKTDRRDARALANASARVDLRSIHIKSVASRELLSETTARRTLVNCRTTIINSVRGWLRTLVIQLRSGRASTFGDRVRKALSEANQNLPQFVDSQLRCIETLNEQIQEMTKQLEAKARKHATCQLLMSHPGVGPLTALEFVATIDEPGRFKHGDKVASYLGLTPGENSSSTRRRRTSITKAGSPELRKLLCQAAWSYWRTQKTQTTQWVQTVADRRGKKIALVALMRKMSQTLWGMWRHNQSYTAMPADWQTELAVA